MHRRLLQVPILSRQQLHVHTPAEIIQYWVVRGTHEDKGETKNTQQS